MPKNDIFESIENNEFIKNLVEDSKKMFDDFLGLAQGKKIKEGFTNNGFSDKYSYLSVIEPNYFKELRLIPHYFSEMSDDIWENVYPICAYTLINMMKNKPNTLRSVDIFDPNNIKLIEYAIEIMLLLHYDRYQGIILTDSGQYVQDTGIYYGKILLLTKAPKTFAATQICNSVPINQVNTLNLESSTQISEMHNSICENGGSEPKPIIMEIAQRKLMNINENDFTKSRFNTIVLLQDGYFLTFNFSKNDGDTTSILNNGLSSDNNFYRFQYQDLFINYNNDLTKQVSWLEWFFNVKNMSNEYDLISSTEIPTKKGISKQELKTILSNLLNTTNNEVNWLTNFTKYIYKVGGPSKYEQDSYYVFDINNFEQISNIGNLNIVLGINNEPTFLGCYKDNIYRTGGILPTFSCYDPETTTIKDAVDKTHKDALLNGNKIFALQYLCGMQTENKNIDKQVFNSIREITNKKNINSNDIDSINERYNLRITDTFIDQYPEISKIIKGNSLNVVQQGENACIDNSGVYSGNGWTNAVYATATTNPSDLTNSKLILDDDPTSQNFGLYISTDSGKIFILKIRDHYTIENDDLMSNPNWKECKYQCDSNNIALESDNNNMLGIGGGKESIVSKNQTIRVWLDLFGIWRFELSLYPKSQNFVSIKQKVIEKMYGYNSSFSIQNGQLNSQKNFSENVIYHNEPNQYPQYWEGVLALEFKVIKPILITHLGCFCNNGNYLNRDINVCICDTNSKIVAGPVTFLKNRKNYFKKDDNPNTLYQKLSTNKVKLTEGTYTIRAQGYGPGEPNQNYGGRQNKNPIGGGGLIKFIGSYWSEPNLPIYTPDINRDGPPFPIRYYSGAFMYEKEEQPTVSQYEITDLFIYNPYKINGSRYNLSYMFNILKIYTTDPTSISEFSADADKNGNLYLKFQDPLSTDGTCYLYQINYDNKNCTEMKSVDDAVILANDYAEYSAQYSSTPLIANPSNYDMALNKANISYPETINDLSTCIELCKTTPDCKFMTYNSAKTCKLYNNEIGKYIIGTNDNNIKTIAQGQSLYMKQCLPYETQDSGLINAGFITRDQTGGEYSIPVIEISGNCSINVNQKIFDSIEITDNKFMKFIKDNYNDLSPLLATIRNIFIESNGLLKYAEDKYSNLPESTKTVIKNTNPKNIISSDILKIKFSNLYEKKDWFKNYFNEIINIIDTFINNKEINYNLIKELKYTDELYKDYLENFQNINEYNINDYTTNDSLNNIKYIKANNNILEKSQIFTNNINNIIKEIDKQSYLNKFNKFNKFNKLNNKLNNNYKDNDNLKNIILLIFITIFLVVILSLIKKR